MNEGGASDLFYVVVNSEEQHSVWPADGEPPAGWQRIGHAASKNDCLDVIEQRWTDIRPASLRRSLQDG